MWSSHMTRSQCSQVPHIAQMQLLHHTSIERRLTILITTNNQQATTLIHATEQRFVLYLIGLLSCDGRRKGQQCALLFKTRSWSESQLVHQAMHFTLVSHSLQHFLISNISLGTAALRPSFLTHTTGINTAHKSHQDKITLDKYYQIINV